MPVQLGQWQKESHRHENTGESFLALFLARKTSVVEPSWNPIEPDSRSKLCLPNYLQMINNTYHIKKVEFLE